MAVDIKAELKRQLEAVEEKLFKATVELEEKTASLREQVAKFVQEKEQINNTIAFLNGEITVPKKVRAGKKSTGGGGMRLSKLRVPLEKWKEAKGEEKVAAAAALDAVKKELLKNGKTQEEIDGYIKSKK